MFFMLMLQEKALKNWLIRYSSWTVDNFRVFFFSFLFTSISPLKSLLQIIQFHLFLQVPVAAVVIMACNRADYLERTIESVLKYVSCSCSLFSTALNSILQASWLVFQVHRYQSSIASKYPLFVSQVLTLVFFPPSFVKMQIMFGCEHGLRTYCPIDMLRKKPHIAIPFSFGNNSSFSKFSGWNRPKC